MHIPHEISRIIHDLINDRVNEPETDPIRILLRKADYHMGYDTVTEGKKFLIVALATTNDAVLKEHLVRIIQACEAEIAAEVALFAAKKSPLTSKKSQ